MWSAPAVVWAKKSVGAVAAATDLELVAAVDTGRVWGSAAGVDIENDVSAIWAKGADVVVDFTVADALRINLPLYAEHGIHAVVGTTGLSESELSVAADAFAASSPMPSSPPTSPSAPYCS